MTQNNYKKQAKKQKQNSALPLVLLLGGALLLVFGAILAYSWQSKPNASIEANGSPSLKVDKEKVDLGDVKLGQSVQVSFQITNAGNQALRFAKDPYIEVKEGC
jgi:hypothetical protein